MTISNDRIIELVDEIFDADVIAALKREELSKHLSEAYGFVSVSINNHHVTIDTSDDASNTVPFTVTISLACLTHTLLQTLEVVTDTPEEVPEEGIEETS